MTNILCYGDSNTFGYNPGAKKAADVRFAPEIRWPGRLARQLGGAYHIIEEGLCGRTTVFEDPSSPGRCGLSWLLPCLHTHQPLALVVVMLGTNDTKAMYHAPAEEIANGLEALLRVAKNPANYNAGVCPEVLVVAPIHVSELYAGTLMEGVFDEGSVRRSQRLAGLYRRMARLWGCHFLDAAGVAAPGIDGIHLDAEGHAALADALEKEIRLILADAQQKV